MVAVRQDALVCYFSKDVASKLRRGEKNTILDVVLSKILLTLERMQVQ